jgi:hypothetical protein
MSITTGCAGFYTNGPADLSGNGRNLTATGSPSTATGPDGVAGSAMLTASISAYYNGSALPTSDPLTISTFIAPNSPAIWQGLALSNDIINAFLSATNGGPQLSFGGSSPVAQMYSAALQPFAPPLSNWMHMLGTIDGSDNETLYINSQLIATADGGGSPWSANFKILNLSAGTVPMRQANTGIWNRVLTSVEIAQLYNGGFGLNPFGSPPTPVSIAVAATGPGAVVATITALPGSMNSLYYSSAPYGALQQVYVGTVIGSGQLSMTGLPPGPTMFTVQTDYAGAIATASFFMGVPGTPSSRRPLASYSGYLGGA